MADGKEPTDMLLRQLEEEHLQNYDYSALDAWPVEKQIRWLKIMAAREDRRADLAESKLKTLEKAKSAAMGYAALAFVIGATIGAVARGAA